MPNRVSAIPTKLILLIWMSNVFYLYFLLSFCFQFSLSEFARSCSAFIVFSGLVGL